MIARRGELPGWVDLGLLPLLNLLAAFVVSGLIVVLLGENPFRAVELLVWGAFGYGEAIGYTLFYATNFIFTGLAVAIAFHCGLFNIGGEGQAYLGGLGVGLVGLYLGFLPFALILPLAVLAAALFGGFWAFVPGWLQARRGSHVVITTIMFNFIAAALMTYLLVNVLIAPGQQGPESATFAENAWLPQLHDLLEAVGIEIPFSPLNLSFVFGLLCCLLLWVFVWQTRWGYALRVVGQNEAAAVYGGISPARQIMLAMTISGALAGFVGLNEIMGAQHRLILGFTGGYGFVGIAVALMGRNHPVGIVLAALLFGALYQGGSELSFDMPRISRDWVVVIQGLVILFAGALENLFRPYVVALFARRLPAEAVA
jgi:simple sugar transport system permease protein